MATINYVWSVERTAGNPVHTVVWSGLDGASSDVGAPFKGAYLADKSVQIMGTLGTFVLEGSNASNPGAGDWHTLNDANGSPINETGGARVEQLLENTLWVRPRVSGAASNVTVRLVGRLAKV